MAGLRLEAYAGGAHGAGGSCCGNFNVIVTGAINNNYRMIGGLVPSRSINIDDWR